MSKLVIVESPAKAHTIQKYLGPDYEVLASMGHVRDLPASRLSVDVKNDFAPNYENIKGKGELIKKLRNEAKKSDYVYLATDPDREGEAISWHLAQLLKLDETEQNRVTFNEITKSGIKYGMEHPRCIDQQLVDAQQARRVLDRIVGYEISPFLWKKIRKGLSAGRVQSVAVRLIVDREDEIRAFTPEEYWTLEALLAKQGAKTKPFTAKYYGTGGKKCEITSEEQANALKAAAEKEPFIIKSKKTGTRQKNPAPPFITSTLQQDASRRYGFQAKRTMKVAQELYEGINLPDMGAVGLITYMRTDSLRISEEALAAAADQGSFTRAAEQLGYTQSGLTHMMDALEREVGFSLLQRDHNGIQLSPQGRQLMPAIREFLQANANLENQINAISEQKKEVIRIAAYASIAMHWMPELLYRYKRVCPEVSVDLRMVDNALEPYELLESGQTDVIFASRQNYSFCDWTPLYNEKMYAILPKDYPLNGRTTFPLEEFSGQDFLMPYGRFDIDVNAAMDSVGVKLNASVSRVDDETVIRMVGHGLGVTMMTELMIRGRTDDVLCVPVDPPRLRELGMGTSRRMKLTDGMQSLKDCMLQFIHDRS